MSSIKINPEFIPIESGDNYIIIGNIGICWGEANPRYSNPNVLTADVTLPITFKSAKAIATCKVYGHASFELDSVAKVYDINGNKTAIALHSNAGKYTDGSTLFLVDYLVIGTIS